MSEEETKPQGDTGGGDKPKELSLLERTNQAAERLEKANEEAARLNREAQEIYAQQKLSGRAEAGEGSKEKELDPVEYSKKVMAGEIPEK